MNIPLPAAAFPIGNKATGAATFVVAVLVGLSMYLATCCRRHESVEIWRR